MPETRVLLSFGGAFGGFPFAWELRNELMLNFGRSPVNNAGDDRFYVYLDAVSLIGEHGSLYRWNDTIYDVKFENEEWADFYEAAMGQAEYMLFLITLPWLQSKWCWQEYDRYLRERQLRPVDRPLKGIFVVFPDAAAVLNSVARLTIDREHNTERELGPFHDRLEMLPENTPPAADTAYETTFWIPQTEGFYADVAPRGAVEFTRIYEYTCSDEMWALIMSAFF